MITLFTIPRAFTGKDKIRQENALGSWTRLTPRPEIIFCCKDPGVAEAARQFDCIHAPEVRCSKKGVPYIGHAFQIAAQLAANNILCYANTDVIFLQDFITAVAAVDQHFDEPYLIVGQRWDVPISEPLEFADGWQGQLRARLKEHGELYPPTGMDYFIYQDPDLHLPDFLVGSPWWDPWLISNAKRRGLQIVDATKAITCIHHAHPQVWPREGIKYNRKMWERSGGGMGYTHSGTWALGAKGKLTKLRTTSDFDRCIQVNGSPDIFMVRDSSMTKVRIGYWGAYVAMGKPPISVVTWAEMNSYQRVPHFVPE